MINYLRTSSFNRSWSPNTTSQTARPSVLTTLALIGIVCTAGYIGYKWNSKQVARFPSKPSPSPVENLRPANPAILPEKPKGWTHLELGAANYGVKGLNGRPTGHENQLSPLYRTIDSLVHAQGETGTFFINDLDTDDCNYAKEQLTNYITKTYPSAAIKVDIIAKSYFDIKIPSDCGVDQVDSIHLKNPDMNRQLDGVFDQREWVLDLVRGSKTGLSIFVPEEGERHIANEGMLRISGCRSVAPLRYSKADKPSPEYVYYNPEGTYRHEWANNTYEYSIVPSSEEERLTPTELAERREQQEEIKRSLEATLVSGRLKIASLTTDIDYPLIAAFSHRIRTEVPTSTINMPDLKCLDEVDVLLSEASKTWHRLLNEQVSFVLKDFELEKSYLDQPIHRVLKKPAAHMLYLKCFQSKTSLSEIWGRLGLKEAYETKFKSKEEFWSSSQSLREIYVELQEIQKTLN